MGGKEILHKVAEIIKQKEEREKKQRKHEPKTDQFKFFINSSLTVSMRKFLAR